MLLSLKWLLLDANRRRRWWFGTHNIIIITVIYEFRLPHSCDVIQLSVVLGTCFSTARRTRFLYSNCAVYRGRTCIAIVVTDIATDRRCSILLRSICDFQTFPAIFRSTLARQSIILWSSIVVMIRHMIDAAAALSGIFFNNFFLYSFIETTSRSLSMLITSGQ